MFTFSGLLTPFTGGAPKKEPNFSGVSPQPNTLAPLAKPATRDNFADFQNWAEDWGKRKPEKLNLPDPPFGTLHNWIA